MRALAAVVRMESLTATARHEPQIAVRCGTLTLTPRLLASQLPLRHRNRLALGPLGAPRADRPADRRSLPRRVLEKASANRAVRRRFAHRLELLPRRTKRTAEKLERDGGETPQLPQKRRGGRAARAWTNRQVTQPIRRGERALRVRTCAVVLRTALAAAVTLVVLTTTATAATPKPHAAWAWTPYEASQVLTFGHPQWNVPGWDTSRKNCSFLPRGLACDFVQQASCTPIGSAIWVGHYADYRCAVVFEHDPASSASPTPQSTTLYVKNSRVGLGTACVSNVSLPATCPGSPVTKLYPPWLLFARINTNALAYWRCADKPNKNGVYQCVVGHVDAAVIATIVPKPLSVTLRPSGLSFKDALCKVFGATSTACKYGG